MWKLTEGRLGNSSILTTPSLQFINLEGDPIKAMKDEAIKTLVRNNARALDVNGAKTVSSYYCGPGIPLLPAPSKVGALVQKLQGSTRFALSSRKPMKRAPRSTKAKSLANDSGNVPPQSIPGSLILRETSSNWVSLNRKPKVARMLLHCKNSLSRLEKKEN